MSYKTIIIYLLVIYLSAWYRRVQCQSSSINNIVFDLADLTIDYETDTGVVNLEAFKSSLNNVIIDKKDSLKYGQLNWLSIGYPTLVMQPKNGTNVTFNLKPEGFDVKIDMLTSSHKLIFKNVVKRKYNINIKEEQIVSLVPAKLTCQIEFTANTERMLINGQVIQLNRFPLKVSFSAPVGSKERTAFEQRLDKDKQNLDLDIVCEVSSSGKAYRQNTLIITGAQINQFAIVDKIFGLGDEKYVTRNQISQLTSQLYVQLNVIEDYQMPETQFKQNFVDDFLAQTASQIYQYTNIDQALSQMSKYNFEVDIQPSVIKSEMSRIFTVAERNSKEVLTLNKTAYEQLLTTYGKNTGGSASGSIFGFSFGASANYANQQSSNWINAGTSFSNQLSELNQYYENEVEWQRNGNIIVPKSVKVSKLSRASFDKDLVFTRVKREYYDAPYQRVFVLNTLNAQRPPAVFVDFNRRLYAMENSVSSVITKNVDNANRILKLESFAVNISSVLTTSLKNLNNSLTSKISNTDSSLYVTQTRLDTLDADLTNYKSISKSLIQQGSHMWYYYPNDMGTRSQKIVFSQAFKVNPTVVVSFKHIDSASDLRLAITVDNLDTLSFDLTVKTWSGTKIYGILVEWTAFGLAQ